MNNSGTYQLVSEHSISGAQKDTTTSNMENRIEALERRCGGLEASMDAFLAESRQMSASVADLCQKLMKLSHRVNEGLANTRGRGHLRRNPHDGDGEKSPPRHSRSRSQGDGSNPMGGSHSHTQGIHIQDSASEENTESELKSQRKENQETRKIEAEIDRESRDQESKRKGRNIKKQEPVASSIKSKESEEKTESRLSIPANGSHLVQENKTEISKKTKDVSESNMCISHRGGREGVKIEVLMPKDTSPGPAPLYGLHFSRTLFNYSQIWIFPMFD